MANAKGEPLRQSASIAVSGSGAPQAGYMGRGLIENSPAYEVLRVVKSSAMMIIDDGMI